MQFMRVLGVCVLASGCLCVGGFVLAADAPTSTVPSKERRLALVIGNADYPFAPLRNSLNDARDFAAALKDSGFDVTILENAKLRDTRNALRDFGDRLKAQGGVGLFYYAGHGMQVKGRNYLIPVAAQIEREDEVEFESLDANQVLEKLDSAGNRFNIVILDACRNNPFARAFRSSTQGLAQMDAPSGAVVAFATSPGSVASDGAGRNGLYTQYLIENVQRPGLKIEEVFKQVRASVRRDSNGQQTPWESTSLEGDFYFHPVDRAALDVARKQREQVRLEEAVRIAIANERARIIKEYEQAMGKPAPGAPPAQSLIIAALPAPEPPLSSIILATAEPVHSAVKLLAETAPTAPVSAPTAIAPDVVATLSPKAPTTAPVTNTQPGQSTASSGAVIGARPQGAITAPQFAVNDEWEFLTITSNPGNPVADPTLVIEKFTVINYYPGAQLGLYRERLDKPGGVGIGPRRMLFVDADMGSAFYARTAIGGKQQILIFPFNPPEKWSYSFEYPMYGGTGKGRDDFDAKVEGWEQVTVPAGTYWAVKVVQRGWSNNLSVLSASTDRMQRTPSRLEFTFWYSPETKSIVQSTRKRFSGLSWSGLADSVATEQLVRFVSAESRAAAAATAATK
jgi:Caspase domain